MRPAALAALLLLLPSLGRALKTERMPSVLSAGAGLEVVSERAFVKFSTGTTAAQRAAAIAGAGASIVKVFPKDWVLVSKPGMPVHALLDLLRALPGVEQARPDRAYRPNLYPNDPRVSQQYALQSVNAFAGWEYGTGGDNTTTVAVIDAGVDSTHAELSGKMAGLGHAFCNPNVAGGPCAGEAGGTPNPACNHATRVAGVAAAAGNNGTGVAGMNWGAKILSIRIFDTNDCLTDCSDANFGLGLTCETSDDAISSAIDEAVALRAGSPATYGRMVINMSIGGPHDGCPGGVVKNSMVAAVVAGIPVVVASGNDGGEVNTPADCAGTTGGSGIIPVGATDSNNSVTFFSSRGPELAANGLVAPGSQVLTTDLGGGYAGATGTSFSSPHAAGLASLMLSEQPTLTVAQVQAYLRAGADSIGGGANAAGAGRMDVFRSMRLAVTGTLGDFVGDQKAIAFPNPFRMTQTGAVSFSVPLSIQGAATTIKIYTAAGQIVRSLTGLSWDGRNDQGEKVASGTYVFVVSSDKGTSRGRFAVIR